ncbi:MAG: hypothetical protein WA696_07650 [Solirubrobacterales bacterium]
MSLDADPRSAARAAAAGSLTWHARLVRRPGRAILFFAFAFAFAFAVMADPVSSVAYAIEAALRTPRCPRMIRELAEQVELNRGQVDLPR